MTKKVLGTGAAAKIDSIVRYADMKEVLKRLEDLGTPIAM